MPDFERIHRSLNIRWVERFNPEKVSLLKAFYDGQDNARKQIVYVALVLASVLHIGCFLLGRYLL